MRELFSGDNAMGTNSKKKPAQPLTNKEFAAAEKTMQALQTAAFAGDAKNLARLIQQTDPRFFKRSTLPDGRLKKLNDGATPLMAAAAGASAECVKLLLPLSNPKEKSATGHTALMLCAFNQKAAQPEAAVECLQALLPVSDVNATGKEGSALVNATRGNYRDATLPLVRALLAAGADGRMSNENGWTPLMQAALHMEKELISLLLPVSDVNAMSDKGENALMFAFWRGSENKEELASVVKMLWEHPDFVLRDSQHASLLSKAPASCLPFLLPRLNAKARDGDGLSALYCAASAGDAEKIAMLLPLSDVSALKTMARLPYAGGPVVSVALADQTGECVRLLLSAGCDPNETDSDGQAPLHRASESYAVHGTLKILLGAQGIQPNLLDKEGYSPLGRVVENNAHELAPLLLENGCDPNAGRPARGRGADTRPWAIALQKATVEDDWAWAEMLAQAIPAEKAVGLLKTKPAQMQENAPKLFARAEALALRAMLDAGKAKSDLAAQKPSAAKRL